MRIGTGTFNLELARTVAETRRPSRLIPIEPRRDYRLRRLRLLAVYARVTLLGGTVGYIVIEGRILNGFHFRTADVNGAWIGKKAAQWINKHYFEPAD